MSAMDRLTDEALEYLAKLHGERSDVHSMARELLVHRRASEERRKIDETCTICRHPNIPCKCWFCSQERASQVAPAPSDGLREAVMNDAIEAVRPVALASFASGCDAHELDEDIRALRRAAPREDR